MNQYKGIIKHFNIYGDFIDAKTFGSGHINDTIIVRYKQAGQKVNYVLRKINNYVFKEPNLIIENTRNITNHIKSKLVEQNVKDSSRNVLTLIKTADDKYFHIDADGKYWCVNLFIKKAFTVDNVENEKQAFEAAKAYGKFQKYLSDFDINECHETIPNFHNLSNRIEKFEDSLKTGLKDRIENAQTEIQTAHNFKYIVNEYENLVKLKLPLRITHNDTKINNVMLDKKTKEGLCVIDLDTVMPGTILNDFGDMVRTFVSRALEDEKDFSQVNVRLKIFEAMTKGYLSELSGILTNDEIQNLVTGAKIIVYEQAIRFLTDFIEGDVYYKVDSTEHNLNRTKNQFALLKSIEKKSTAMEKIVEKYSHK